MNQDIKTEWLKRLRSDRYRQGQGYLNREGKFCCLGVLCEIAFEQGVVPKYLNRDMVTYTYGDTACVLPREVMDWAGLDSREPRLDKGHNLTHLNDEGFTFTEIADLIENDPRRKL